MEHHMFDGQNYAFWSRRMKTFVQAQGFDVWKEVVDGYTTPTTPPIDKDGKKLSENNSRDKNAILNGLAIQYMSRLCIVTLQRIFGTNFKISMKEMPKSKGPSFKLIEVNLNN
jgi:hypothetical protein